MNQLICADVSYLAALPSEFIDCVMTSPPYWGLRSYPGVETIWDGDPACRHEWGERIIKRNRGKTRGEPAQVRNNANERQGRESDRGAWCQKCGAWRGQLGLEPDFNLYLDHMIAIFAEVKRVLKPGGTCFVNLGDTYAANRGYQVAQTKWGDVGNEQRMKVPEGLKAKSLCQIPERFGIRMTDELGWRKRNLIPWIKPNAMPGSAKDRFSNCWEPVMFFVKERKYWFDLDAVRIEHSPDTHPYGKGGSFEINADKKTAPTWGLDGTQSLRGVQYHKYRSAGGKNPGDIIEAYEEFVVIRPKPLPQEHPDFWTIPTHPFTDYYCPHCDELIPGRKIIKTDDGKLLCPKCSHEVLSHFAMFPEKLVERPIKAGCPEWICRKCGTARERIVEPSEEYEKHLGQSLHDHKDDMGAGMSQKKPFPRINSEYKTIGWTDCGCDAGWRPGIVLDPFAGAGTTLLVAHKLRRSAIGIDLSLDYCRMAKKRLEPFLNQTVLL